MKKIAFVLYVGCVLVFSAFARAEMMMPFSKTTANLVSVQINSVLVDQQNVELKIAGYLPNACTAQPSATLIPDNEKPNSLVLHLISPVHSGICTEQVVPYNTIVNLPVLAQNTVHHLNPQTTYTIRTENHDFEIAIEGADLLRVPGFIAQ